MTHQDEMHALETILARVRGERDRAIAKFEAIARAANRMLDAEDNEERKAAIIEWQHEMARQPDESFDRLRAEWRAEAIEIAVERGYRSRDELAGWAEQLRRQAEGGGNGSL